jgi:dTMP kinase
MVRGKFITVEGSEGVGKSTNVDFLASAIKDHGYEVICTREPGGTPIAERIRQILLEHGEEPLPDIAELLLFFASRSLHISNKIRPALEAGKWVICDRFTDASRAYQGAGRGLDMERINLLADWVQDDLQPDMTLLLDAPAEIGMQRAQQRGATDRLESEQISFYERVRAGYLVLAEANPGRYRVVDATRPLQEVQVSIGAVLEQMFSDNSD